MEVVIAPLKWKELQPNIIENHSVIRVTDIHRG